MKKNLRNDWNTTIDYGRCDFVLNIDYGTGDEHDFKYDLVGTR